MLVLVTVFLILVLIIFSYSIANFTWSTKSNFSSQLKEGRPIFKYFPGSNSNDLLLYIESKLGNNNSRSSKWLIKQHHRYRSFTAKYLEDSSQMQNSWYQQDFCFKCAKYMLSFKWYVYEVQFWYKISVRVTVFSLLITVTYQWFFV